MHVKLMDCVVILAERSIRWDHVQSLVFEQGTVRRIVNSTHTWTMPNLHEFGFIETKVCAKLAHNKFD